MDKDMSDGFVAALLLVVISGASLFIGSCRREENIIANCDNLGSFYSWRLNAAFECHPKQELEPMK